MHKSILDATIASVRLRDSQGDCPTEPAFSVEHLEGALLTLAGEMAQPAYAVREALRQAEEGLAAMIRLSEMGFEESMREPEENGNFASYEKAKRCLIAVRTVLASDPAPAGEAVEPVAWRVRLDSRFQWQIIDYDPAGSPNSSEYQVEPLFAAHPAPEDTARLREDLERVTRELAEENQNAQSLASDLSGLMEDFSKCQRERDDARKALEKAAEDERDRLLAVATELADRPNTTIGWKRGLETVREFLKALGATPLASREAQPATDGGEADA